MIVKDKSDIEVNGFNMSFGKGYPPTRLRDKVLCFFGLHEWIWSLDSVEYADSPMPDCAKCIHCGIVHKQTGGSAE